MAVKFGTRALGAAVVATALLIGAAALGYEADTETNERKPRTIRYTAFWSPEYVRAEKLIWGVTAERKDTPKRPAFEGVSTGVSGEIASIFVVLPRTSKGTIGQFKCQVEVIDGPRRLEDGEGRECYAEVRIP